MTLDQSVTARFTTTGGGTGGGGGGGTGGGGGSGSGGGSGGGGHTTSAPKCVLAAGNGIPLKTTRSAPAGMLAVTVKCNEDATATVSGTLTIRTKSGRRTKTTTVSLGPVRAVIRSGVAAVERLRLPASAIRALRRGASESVLVKLTATNPHGTNRATTTVAHLRRA
jgi:hypothetical protein